MTRVRCVLRKAWYRVMAAIVGYMGYVGSNLLQFYEFDYLYNSKNFEQARNKSFKTLYFAGLPAEKWKANLNPDKDAQTLRNIQSILDTIEVERFVLISTIDVYTNTNSQDDEQCAIDHTGNHTYGKNRRLFELYIQKRFKRHHIVRLPALFGKGLKKNLIYDLLNGNCIDKINKQNWFQWYSLDWLQNDLDIVMRHNLPICNLFTEPISSNTVVEIYEETYRKRHPYPDDTNMIQVKYNLKSAHASYFNGKGGFIRDADAIKSSIRDFLEFEKIDKSQLSVSNICINKVSSVQFATILKLHGIDKVQVAPTKLIKDWNKIDELDLSENFKELKVRSLQSVCYGLNELNIFSPVTRPLLFLHLQKVIDFAERNAIDYIVFG